MKKEVDEVAEGDTWKSSIPVKAIDELMAALRD